MAYRAYIKNVNGRQFLVRRGTSGDVTGWMIFDRATGECLSGAFRLLGQAFIECRSLAAAVAS